MLYWIEYKIDGELINMKDCMAYGEGTTPSQHNPTSELDVVYASINWHNNLTGYNNYIVEHYIPQWSLL